MRRVKSFIFKNFLLNFLTKWIYILAAFTFYSLELSAQSTIIFNKAVEDELLAGKMYIYKDKSGVATFNTIAGLQNSFIPNIDQVPHFTNTKDAIWLKTHISIETEEPTYLEICYPMMDSVQLFTVGNNGNVISQATIGSLLPISDREIESNSLRFRLSKGRYTYYIRAKSTYTLQLPIRIKTYTSISKDSLSENIFQGIYLGFAILIILFTLFLWVALKDKVFALYSLHISTTAIKALFLGGYAYLLFWPNNSWINLYEPTIFATGIFSLIFAVAFLETKVRLKKLHKWFMFLITANLFIYPLDWLGFHSAANYAVQIIGMVSCISMLVAGIIAGKNGFKPARFFLLAWTFFLAGVVITIFQRVGILNYNYFVLHAAQIGSALDIILLSFALADRMSIKRNETEKYKQETFQKIAQNEEFMRQQNALLSLRVEERSREMQEQTAILGKQKEELEDLNTTKDKILSVIAHDLRGPLSNVSQLANMMGLDKKLRNDETIGLLKDASKRSFDLLDSLLHWAKAQFGDAEYNLTKVNLYSLANDTLELYLLKAKAKEISIKNNIPQNLYANADIDMVNTIVRNLISNALKFTIVGGEINIGGKENIEEETVTIWVEDSGLGISPEKLATIFEAGKNKSVKGTDGEIGTGLGLVICKDFVEKNNGTITVTSNLGKGSTFTITLPRYN